MDAADFLERIKDRSLLKKSNAKEWAELSEKYPYASVVQLLNFQAKDKNTKKEIDTLRLHFENPLLFNQVTKQDKESGVEVEEKQEELKKEIEELLSEEDIKEETAVESETPVEEKSEIQDEQSENNEDVLELIKDLPEENPIEKAKREVSHVAEEDVNETIEEEESEDPGDLMVMMSFTDWLQYFKAKKENEEEDKKGRDAIRSAWQKEKLAEAMDDEEDVVPDEIFEKAMKSVSFGDGLVTEPLAELYVQQGKTDKAIELYKKLSLLNPEKRTYFADRIKDLHL